MPIPRSTLQFRFIQGLLLAAGLATTAPRAVATPFFAAPFLSFDSGGAPYSVAVADLKGDARPDLVLANPNSNTVSVLLGRGDGTFNPKNDYAVGTSPQSVIIADVNGDGRADILCANGGSSTVSVLLGHGDGTFGARNDYATSGGAASLAIGDLNGDGKLDLAVGSGNGVSVMPGHGDGTFGPSFGIVIPGAPYFVALGDMNGDGRLDLVTANYNGGQLASVSVLLGNGNGTFGARTDYPAGYDTRSVVLGDVNMDGKLDVVAVSGYGTSAVSVMLGNGDGTLGPARDLPSPDAYSAVIEDVNLDGIPDLVVANSDNSVSAFLGNGDGTFKPRRDFPAGAYNKQVAIADLNGDGKPDLAVASSNDNGNNLPGAASVLLGNGDGTFGTQSQYRTAFDPTSIASGDLNKDGKLDIATSNYGFNEVSVFLGNGDGSFGPRTDYGMADEFVALADLNGDGKLDLVSTTISETIFRSDAVSVRLGNGDGTFGANNDYPAGPNPFVLSIGDLNGDGKPDVVVVNGAGLQSYVSELLGNGDGTLRAASPFGTADYFGYVAIGDLNGDGKSDVMVLNPLVGTVSVFLGNGDGTFRTRSDYPTGANPTWVGIGDFNADGKPDLAVVAGRGVAILLGNGDGTFGPPRQYLAGNVQYGAAIGDLNGDGKLDIAVVNNWSNTVSVFFSNGDGTLGPKSDYGTGGGPEAVVIGDFDGDGRADLAVSNQQPSSFMMLLNTGGSIPTPVDLALVDAHAVPGRVDLRWYGGSMAGMSATVYRQTAGTAWTVVATIVADGTGIFAFEDAGVRPGSRYGYRLGIREGGVEKFYGETWVSVPALAMALEGLRPNPAVGEAVASFILPSGSSARLELLDVTGRVWLAREVGDLGAGSHLVRLGGSVPAGIYWLRLTQGGRSLLARGAVVR